MTVSVTNRQKSLTLFLTASVCLFYFYGYQMWAASWQHAERGSRSNITGFPQYYGYSETLEQVQAAGFIVSSIAVAFGAYRLSSWIATVAGWKTLTALVLLILGLASFMGWPGWILNGLALAFLPWKHLKARWQSSPPALDSWAWIAGAFAFSGALGMQLHDPWEPVPPTNVFDVARHSSLFLLGLALSASISRMVSLWRPNLIPLWRRICLVSPLWVVLRLLDWSLTSFLGMRLFSSTNIPGLMLGGFLILIHLKKQKGEALDRKLLAHFTLPFFLWIMAYRNQASDPFDSWHEGEILHSSLSLLEGKIPYKDLIIPHGAGNALWGTLGMALAGKDILASRFAYHLLPPLVWMLHYWLLFISLGRKARPLLVFALTLFALGISQLNRPYLLGMISWHGGIKLLQPLVCFCLLGLMLKWRTRLATRYFCLGFCALLGFFMSIEYGVSVTTAVAFVAVRDIFSNRNRILSVSVCALPPLVACFFFRRHLEKFSYHLFDWTFEYSQRMGLPFFKPVAKWVTGDAKMHFVTGYTPLLCCLLGLITAWRLRQDKNRSALLLALSGFTISLFTVSITRSNTVHLQIGLGLSGLLICLILVWSWGTRTALSVAICALFLGLPYLNAKTIYLSLVRKKQTDFKVSTVRVDSPLERNRPLLTQQNAQQVLEVKRLLSRHPDLGNKLFMKGTERNLFELFLDVTKQRALTSDRDFRLAIVAPNYVYMPSFVLWPREFQALFDQFVPCAALPGRLAAFVRKGWETQNCSSEVSLDEAFSSTWDLAHLPAFLGRQKGKWIGSLRPLHLDLPETTRRRKVKVTWACDSRYFEQKEMAVSFFTEPKQTHYALPLGSIPSFVYCKSMSRQSFKTEILDARD